MDKILKIKYVVLFTFCCNLFSLNGQDDLPKYKLSLGYGSTLLGSGDYYVNNYVFELNKELKSKIDAYANLTLGLSSDHISRKYNLNYFQINLNFTRSVWQPTKFYTLKLGGGASFFKYSYVSYFDQILIGPNITILTLGEGEEYLTLGYNLLINNEFNASEKIFVTISALGQFYGINQNIGIIISMGTKF
jgi:hypothetical protein